MKQRIAVILTLALMIIGAVSCKEDIYVTGVSIGRTSLVMEKGSTEQLYAAVEPSDAKNQTIYWSTSDASVVSVTTSGLLTAVSPGSAVITVTSDDGDFTARCEVTVIVTVQGVQVSPTTLELYEGENSRLSVTLIPEDVTDRTVTWKSSDTNIATVNDQGTVYGKNRGKCVVTVVSGDGTCTSSCEVTVKAASSIGYKPYGDEENW